MKTFIDLAMGPVALALFFFLIFLLFLAKDAYNRRNRQAWVFHTTIVPILSKISGKGYDFAGTYSYESGIMVHNAIFSINGKQFQEYISKEIYDSAGFIEVTYYIKKSGKICIESVIAPQLSL